MNLDAATGKLRWYYQGVANDFMDHGMQTSPIAATVNGQPAVIGSGKMGVVYAMNASTGQLIWKTPVGEHSKSDDYPLEALEHTLTLTALHDPARLPGRRAVQPGPGRRHRVRGHGQPAVLSRQDELSAGRPGRQRQLGAATVSNDLVFTTLYTGVLIALDRATGAIVYQRKLPTSANAPIAIAGNSVLVPAGGPNVFGPEAGSPQLVVYTVR